MRKIVSAVLAVTLCMGTFTSCDKKGDKNSGGALSVKGKYTSIIPLDGSRDLLIKNIDSGIKYSINSAKRYEKDNKDAKYNPWVIEFSGNKFVMPNIMASKGWIYYDGTFSVKNGAIKFSYENYIHGDEKINVKDKAEPDFDIVYGKSEKLDGLSEEEKIEMIKNEQYKMKIQGEAEIMQDLNTTEAYFKLAAPLMNFSDKWKDFALLPYIRFAAADINTFGRHTELPNTLKTVDDFLCTDTYGIKLKGSYENGKDFKLKHNFIDTLKKDEQSPYQWEDDPEEWLEHMTELAEKNYYCGDLNSTIEFSDGEWEWYNADDELLNNGKYEESKKYPGLIKMYVDEDSEKCPVYAENAPLWFYIADDGEIYYPAFVKVE